MNELQPGMINPFSGSTIVITKFYTEDEVDPKENFGEKEDENERYILYCNGVLIKKTKSSVFYS